jgi:hypothetical protein
MNSAKAEPQLALDALDLTVLSLREGPPAAR